MAQFFVDSQKRVRKIDNDEHSLSSKQLKDSGATLISADQYKILLEKKKKTNQKNAIGLTPERVGRGFNNGSSGDQEQRKKGNEVIGKVVQLSKDQSSNKIDNYIIHGNHVFNEYNGIQREFAIAEKNIDELIEGTKSSDPKKWKWLSPISLQTDNESTIPHPTKENTVTSNPKHDLISFDGHNLSFISDAYKNQVGITTMSPKQYMELASPEAKTEEEFVKNSHGGQKTINELAEKFRKGTTIDTPFLTVNKEMNVTGHEGRHRALGAMKAGIDTMPVYVYGSSSFDFTDQNLKDISRFPRTALTPDFPR